MYTVAVKRELVAQHFLIGGDWGAENEKHSHHYRVELQLSGDSLDRHGFMVDIIDIESHLDDVIAGFRDTTLNDQPLFAGLNPSIEHFARILCEELSQRILAPNLANVAVQVWENDIAWARFQLTR